MATDEVTCHPQMTIILPGTAVIRLVVVAVLGAAYATWLQRIWLGEPTWARAAAGPRHSPRRASPNQTGSGDRLGRRITCGPGLEIPLNQGRSRRLWARDCRGWLGRAGIGYPIGRGGFCQRQVLRDRHCPRARSQASDWRWLAPECSTECHRHRSGCGRLERDFPIWIRGRKRLQGLHPLRRARPFSRRGLRYLRVLAFS